MAARLLLSDKPLPHTLADDLESFLHVLSWVALRFMGHRLTSQNLTDVLTMMFDSSYEDEDGIAKGGRAKKNFLIAAEILASGFRNNNIVSLLAVLTKTIAARYEVPIRASQCPGKALPIELCGTIQMFTRQSWRLLRLRIGC